ncbi:hypothetical protein [uncultured Alistipes sp.]|uniref:hypothetical protein n=1 Tax=uncultured Alistipes sp. TaxID=538949 RepID=UPI00263075EA|nr:hypothetical protein [uncultured Alistipes sp.]
MATNPFTWVNRRGSAAVQSTGVTVTADNVVFAFPNHAFATGWYRGTVFVNLAQDVPTGTTGTLPVVFETNGVRQAVTKYGGTPLTIADLPGVGVYEMWFDRPTNVLQIMTGAV